MALPLIYRIVQEGDRGVSTSTAAPADYFHNVPASVRISADDICEVRYPPLGTGDFGTVCRAKMLGRDVAVKLGRTPPSSLDTAALSAWAREVQTLSAVKHRNVVEFVGVVVEPPMVVLELMQCSLYQLYHAEPDALRKPARCMRVLVDVARGLAHLHGLAPAVLHRDLTSSNVLLTADYRAKIADFDSQRCGAAARGAMLHRRSKVAWTAPEALMKTAAAFSAACDIYSAGIVSFEVFACTAPYSDARFDFEITQRVMGGGRPDTNLLGDATPAAMIKCMQRCWSADPSARPSSDAFKQRVESILEKLGK
eukprot:TRINITY_DN84_c0_g1_i3.p2 TRINITY_DN84_c0_g1~~TRINITY_DN84_c0_g1_i3.p2  ORF type:complete len:311 (+),score=217.78 TRINITY_DN84_c0_g1_i3:196-1128(+)